MICLCLQCRIKSTVRATYDYVLTYDTNQVDSEYMGHMFNPTKHTLPENNIAQ